MADKKEKINIKCLFCKLMFLVHPYRAKTAKYCSYSCKAKSSLAGWNKGKKNTWYNPKGLSLGHGWNRGLKRYWDSPAQFKKGLIPWNFDGKSSANKLARTRFERETIKVVLERDNHKCVLCGEGGYLHVDHIQPFSEYIEGRFDVNNCRTLCRPCHYKVTFGKEMPKNSKWGLKPRKELYGRL